MFAVWQVELLRPGRSCWSDPFSFSAIHFSFDLFKPDHHFVVLFLHIYELLLKAFILFHLLKVALVHFSEVCYYILVFALHPR
jgi:hypothetical protein